MAEQSSNSSWSVQVPWQTGTDKDFEGFKEQMQQAREESVAKPAASDDVSSDGAEEIPREILVGSESEEEDDPAEGPDPGPSQPKSRILWAAEHNQLELVKEMLTEKPGLVGARDEDLYTPLHRAAYNNHVQMVRLLLNKGADPLAQTDTGWTPLHSAVKWNNAKCAEVLLSAGVPVNTVSEGGLTPLHVAAMSSTCRDCIELLLMQPDVDLSLVSNQGDTAMEIASRSGPLAPLFQAAQPKSAQRHREQTRN